MHMKLVALATAALLLHGSHAAAVAVNVGNIGNLMDFTDNTVFNVNVGKNNQPITGVFGGSDFAISASGKLNFAEKTISGACPAALACGQDGVGVNDDEITHLKSGSEWIVIDFLGMSKFIEKIYLLDLFRKDNTNFEVADINGVQYAATAAKGTAGFAIIDFNKSVTKLIFTAPGLMNNKYDNGNNDYAVAAISTAVSSVPVPASVLMLLSAVGGLGFMGRWRKAMTAG